MKRKLVFPVAVSMAILMSCNNGANDGDAKTDTTNMPVDTNINQPASDHTNRADGTQMLDTTRNDSASHRQ